MKPGNNVGNPLKMRNYVASFKKLVSRNNGPPLQTNQRKE
jgi:hypothetical protein